MNNDTNPDWKLISRTPVPGGSLFIVLALGDNMAAEIETSPEHAVVRIKRARLGHYAIAEAARLVATLCDMVGDSEIAVDRNPRENLLDIEVSVAELGAAVVLLDGPDSALALSAFYQIDLLTDEPAMVVS